MESNIQSFFKDKVVFITGGTGFLGKVLIETLIRTTDIKKLYILVRRKHNKDESERFKEIFQDPLYDNLHLQRPEFPNFLQLITGDCAETNLGISLIDRQELIENVDIILHLAATVRFNESLSVATKINVRGTVELIKLSKEMRHLKTFVHVSTAFVNCTTEHCDERFYTDKLSVNSRQLLALLDNMDSKLFDQLERILVMEFPNTYTFSKAVTEEFIQNDCGSLPICIVRPGGVVPIGDDNLLTGWINHMHGGLAVTYCAGLGCLRVINGNGRNRVGMVPVDYCANEIIAAAWYTGSTFKTSSSNKPMIFNLAPDESNTIEWGIMWRNVKLYICKAPYSKMIWYPFLIYEPSWMLYQILNFVYGTIPAYLMDGFLMLLRKPTKMVKMHKKMYYLTNVIRHFVINDFTFGTSNTRNLWQSMSIDDQKLYNFNMIPMDWERYIYKMAMGLRQFIAKDKDESIPMARHKLRRFRILNFIVHGLIVSIFLLLIWKTARILI